MSVPTVRFTQIFTQIEEACKPSGFSSSSTIEPHRSSTRCHALFNTPLRFQSGAVSCMTPTTVSKSWWKFLMCSLFTMNTHNLFLFRGFSEISWNSESPRMRATFTHSINHNSSKSHRSAGRRKGFYHLQKLRSVCIHTHVWILAKAIDRSLLIQHKKQSQR